MTDIIFIFLPSIIILALLIAFIYNSASINNLEEQKQISPVTNRYSTGSHNNNFINSQIVYVPVYSHINRSSGVPQLLETTLSIRNSDPKNNITLLSASYYGTDGHKLQNYYKEPKVLKPLQSTEILVKKEILVVVQWIANIPIYEPVIVGNMG